MPVPVHYKPPPTPSAATQPPSPPLSSSQLLSTSTHSLSSSWSQILPSTSSLDPLHLPRSSYARAARAFLQRRYADALLDSQAALQGVAEVLSRDAKAEGQAAQPARSEALKLLERLLILRLTLFSSVYAHPSSSSPPASSSASQPFLSLLPQPSQDQRSAPIISRLELPPLDFVLQSWWEVLTSYAPALASQSAAFHPATTKDTDALRAVLQLPPSLVASCILSALRIEDNWQEAFKPAARAKGRGSGDTDKGTNSAAQATPSRQMSEFILAAHREASPPSPQLDAHPAEGEGAIEAASQLAREMDRRKAQFAKTLELYAIHVLGVRGGEWEFAREVVGLTDGLDMVERNALLHRLDVAYQEVQTREERSKAANDAARKAYEEERTRRANAATVAAAAAAAAAAASAASASPSADAGPLSDSEQRGGSVASASVTRPRPRAARRGSTSSANSWTSAGGGATTGDESESSPTRPSSAARRAPSTSGSRAKASRSGEASAAAGGEDFASKRQAVRDYLGRGAERGASTALVSDDEVSSTSATRRSTALSRSSGGASAAAASAQSSSPASRNEALASTGLNALLDRLRSFFALLGSSATTAGRGSSSALSRLLSSAAVVVAVLMILRRSALLGRSSSARSIGGGGGTQQGGVSGGRRRIAQAQGQSQGSVMGRAVAKVWETITMGTKVSYL